MESGSGRRSDLSSRLKSGGRAGSGHNNAYGIMMPSTCELGRSVASFTSKIGTLNKPVEELSNCTSAAAHEGGQKSTKKPRDFRSLVIAAGQEDLVHFIATHPQ